MQNLKLPHKIRERFAIDNVLNGFVSSSNLPREIRYKCRLITVGEANKQREAFVYPELDDRESIAHQPWTVKGVGPPRALTTAMKIRLFCWDRIVVPVR